MERERKGFQFLIKSRLVSALCASKSQEVGFLELNFSWWPFLLNLAPLLHFYSLLRATSPQATQHGHLSGIDLITPISVRECDCRKNIPQPFDKRLIAERTFCNRLINALQSYVLLLSLYMRFFCKPTRDHDALYPRALHPRGKVPEMMVSSSLEGLRPLFPRLSSELGKVPGTRKITHSIDQGLLPRGEFYGRGRDSVTDTASLSSLSSDDDSSVHSSTLEDSSKADWRHCFEINKHTHKTRRRSSLSQQTISAPKN